MAVADLIARVLQPDEWAESLKGTELDGIPLDPVRTIVCVVEEDDVVIACLAIVLAVHANGLWIAESHRGHAGTARALVTVVTEELVKHQIAEILAHSEKPEIDDLYQHAGGKKIPGNFWVIPVGEGAPK